VTPLWMVLFLLVPLGGLAAYAVLRPRHRCAYNDPLCRRDRPCIACYRELFKEAQSSH
jgi:hypothetical protein